VLLALLLVAATFVAYQPAWHGGVLWDDQGFLTKPALESASGLRRIWFEVGAAQGYYPLLHSLFWLEHRLWGDAMAGYHAVTLALHALCALLVAAILRRFAVPGALLAAGVFALHPVHVESVAWVSEQKNTLSGALVLAAVLLYLRFDEGRRLRDWLLATACIAAALAAKTVVAMVPAALPALLWWKRGRLGRRDLAPLAPWLALGAGAGLFTASLERGLYGASGAEFALTAMQRLVVAGRAAAFYLGKLLWPAELAFNYPRWQIPPGPSAQLLWPAAAAAALAGAWLVRRRTRAPLAALLWFGIMLFPVLGFLNVVPFFYSFVADHFQYLASLGPISLCAAGATVAARERLPRPAAVAGAAAIVAVLGVLTWRQSAQYADVETLYRSTIARNPSSWLALNNLCNELERRGNPAAALPLCERAVRLKPDWAVSRNTLGAVLGDLGRIEEALPHLREAARLQPRDFLAFANLGVAALRLGRPDEAIGYAAAAARLAPGDAPARTTDRKSTRLNSSHNPASRMPSSA
jgi:tetratricopeptide (TPR) repeat protein